MESVNREKSDGNIYENEKYIVEIHSQKIKEYDPLFQQDGYSFEVGLRWRNYIHYIKEGLNMNNNQIFTSQELEILAEEFANKIIVKEQL